MRLYVRSKTDRTKKIFLRAKAPTRNALAKKLGKSRLKIKGVIYSLNEVYAEAEGSDTAAGALIGGLLGLFVGPLGVLLGGTAGGLIGSSTESKEKEAISRFNNSRYEKSRI